MPNAALSHSTEPITIFAGTRWGVAVVLAAWFTLIMGLGAAGAFVTPPGTPPIPIAIAVGAPIVLFLGALWMSRAFRKFVLAADIRPKIGRAHV